ncbi:MAG: YbaN family protein [Candidatus Thiodiazotropha sp.]
MSMANSDPQSTRKSQPWLLAAGWVLFALGVVGIFLPVMPTTVFWIGAVWCWSRSAPHLTQRILSHPRFGQPVHLFVSHGMMTRSGKWLAIGGIVAGYLLLHLLGHPVWPVSLLLGLTLALIAAWLWRRPEPAVEPIPQTSGLSISDRPETSFQPSKDHRAD